MDIRQLHYFLVLCDEMNYSRAAQRLFLSRQALRQSISALDGEQRAVRREFLPDELLEGLQIALDRLADHIECYHNRTLCLRRKKFCRIQTDRFPRRNTTVPSLGSIRAKVVIFR